MIRSDYEREGNGGYVRMVAGPRNHPGLIHFLFPDPSKVLELPALSSCCPVQRRPLLATTSSPLEIPLIEAPAFRSPLPSPTSQQGSRLRCAPVPEARSLSKAQNLGLLPGSQFPRSAPSLQL